MASQVPGERAGRIGCSPFRPTTAALSDRRATLDDRFLAGVAAERAAAQSALEDHVGDGPESRPIRPPMPYRPKRQTEDRLKLAWPKTVVLVSMALV